MDVQTILASPPWWFPAVGVAVSIAGGILSGLSVTQGAKYSFKRIIKNPLKDGACRMWGRISTLVATASIWATFAELFDWPHIVALPLSIFTALLAPIVWTNFTKVLRAWKPEIADRLSGQ